MCVLCRDTFSRSDILKRHFQKCSIRRGNPTGKLIPRKKQSRSTFLLSQVSLLIFQCEQELAICLTLMPMSRRHRQPQPRLLALDITMAT